MVKYFFGFMMFTSLAFPDLEIIEATLYPKPCWYYSEANRLASIKNVTDTVSKSIMPRNGPLRQGISVTGDFFDKDLSKYDYQLEVKYSSHSAPHFKNKISDMEVLMS